MVRIGGAAKEGANNGGGNCLGCRDFEKWLTRLNLEAIAKIPYPGWCVDGDFFAVMGLPLARMVDLLQEIGVRYEFGALLARPSA